MEISTGGAAQIGEIESPDWFVELSLPPHTSLALIIPLETSASGCANGGSFDSYDLSARWYAGDLQDIIYILFFIDCGFLCWVNYSIFTEIYFLKKSYIFGHKFFLSCLGIFDQEIVKKGLSDPEWIKAIYD